ncbi:MAG: hypothetical protein HY736_00950 [Verrucomicrobia bacterium]|nr:hypothetical protein [Verrucomicrobiota bacterium]
MHADAVQWTRRGCYAGMACCVAFTAWAILTGPRHRVVDLGFNFPLHPILIGLCSHLVLFGAGFLASRLFGGHVPDNVESLTYWSTKKTVPAATEHYSVTFLRQNRQISE